MHLHALSVQLQSEGAAAYATTKFEAMLGRAELYQEAQLSALLPHTRAWLADASGQLPHIEQVYVGRNFSSLRQHQTLPQLRAGLGSASSGSDVAAQQRRLVLAAPVDARSWQGLVRQGLVRMVSGEGIIGRLTVPETLRLDAMRLHAAQVRNLAGCRRT